MATKTVMKDGIVYHKISKDLYIKHKQDNWTDRRIMQRYGMHNNMFSEWKKKNLSQKEIESLSLKKGPEIKSEVEKVNVPEQETNETVCAPSYEKKYRKALTEIESLKKANEQLLTDIKKLDARIADVDELSRLKDKEVFNDYVIENHKNRIQELLADVDVLERENSAMRELVKLWS